MNKNVKLEEVKNEEMYVLVAPDGSWQGMTLSPDFQTCVAVLKLLHQKGLSKSFHEMIVVGGYEILPVKVSMMQNGTAEEGFQRAKRKM